MISTLEVFQSLNALGSSLTREWKVPTDLPYFNGHFPGNPIFPAVGIVDASICVLASVLNEPNLVVPTILSAKFTHPIAPGDFVRISCKRLGGREWSVDWRQADEGGDKAYASLRLQVDQ
jgi:3-hydroxymyristoyl/3-hydroxydecanoyl-(acyl carrier protein) dehydratase